METLLIKVKNRFIIIQNFFGWYKREREWERERERERERKRDRERERER